MKLKKTIASLLITAFLAVIIALPASASTIYFTSINNVLMPLSDSTMPINYNSLIYIPYSVFNSMELGTYSIYSSSAQIVTVFGNGVQLYFNLKEGKTYDNQGDIFKNHAIYQDGLVYLPAAFTCQYFDINYSAIYGSEYGTIVRMTVGKVLSDSVFADAAEKLMKSRLDDYNNAKASAAVSPTPTRTPVRTPVITTPSPNVSPSPGRPVDHSDVDVYLSFTGLDPELTPRILNALDLRQHRGCFFLSAEEIAAFPDLVRRINGSGHGIGLICTESLTESYRTAAGLLYEATHNAAFLIASDASADTAEEPFDYAAAAEENGLIYYRDISEAVSLSLSACTKQLEAAENRCDLLFTTDSETAGSLSELLRLLRNENYHFVRLSEINAAHQEVNES